MRTLTFSSLLNLIRGLILSLTLLGSWAQANTLVTPAAAVMPNAHPMFNVNAINALTVQFLSVDMIMSATPQTFTIYGRPGTYLGNEFTPAAWSIIGQGILGPVPAGVVDLPNPLNVQIPAGGTYAFYVTTSAGFSNIRTSALMAGTQITADANLQLFSGTNMSVSLFGFNNPGSAFSGKITYCLAGTCPVPPTSIPTLSEYGMMALPMLVMAFGLGVIRRRRG